MDVDHTVAEQDDQEWELGLLGTNLQGSGFLDLKALS